MTYYDLKYKYLIKPYWQVSWAMIFMNSVFWWMPNTFTVSILRIIIAWFLTACRFQSLSKRARCDGFWTFVSEILAARASLFGTQSILLLNIFVLIGTCAVTPPGSVCDDVVITLSEFELKGVLLKRVCEIQNGHTLSYCYSWQDKYVLTLHCTGIILYLNDSFLTGDPLEPLKDPGPKVEIHCYRHQSNPHVGLNSSPDSFGNAAHHNTDGRQRVI